ncbi:C-type lectin-related protein 4 [Plakobranchus ocellatus]|uniref:C-type lectin-related protein 4 n=1 Tax=Plakobranchus ocellatus TaxID=259542 RepID=A0AAV3YQR5_9GAST|nr:C-type lectin-related protein 4 [Plakobranchus ocellatus]
MTFFKNSLGGSANDTSLTSPYLYRCSSYCLSSSDPCTSYLYSKSLGQCLYGASVSALDVFFWMGEGDLYAGCNTGGGYKVYRLGHTKACLMMFEQKMVSWMDEVIRVAQILAKAIEFVFNNGMDGGINVAQSLTRVAGCTHWGALDHAC